ncbi:RNA-binding domain-containing protein [Chondromyces apiculatus]|uniref:ATP-dependent DNA helicase n=1 Tax=Chondromyces apiculatus DSM 436 TaxID=1192034 RepID=A0A017TGN5_9BACT|nr:RNA-binding domain-containing protein [Chondromyces apiculatus]EYF08453.1 ATP-dependent DNA helicase [Chondromyces apiculatus DSM 436]
MLSCLPINIDDLLHFRGVESARVEFKASWNEDHTLGQMLETICAFANDFYNVNGGYIVLGVEERDGVALLPPKGLNPEQLDRIQKTIQGNCQRLAPPYQPVLSPEVVDGKYILVIWAHASDTRPHQGPSWRQPSERAYFVRLGPETKKAEGQVRTDLIQMAAKVPFDVRLARSFTVDDLRFTLVREYLRDVRSRLLDGQDEAEIYRSMQLIARVNGHEAPRNVALLFFTDDPEEKGFRGARIEVVHFADDAGGSVLEERIFRGPLNRQIIDCLTYLRNLLVSQVEKHPDRAEASGWVSFPYEALEETIVNAVYHRSYEGMPEPTKVYLYPDRMEITSYPGPMPGLTLEHFRSGKRMPQVPARNRRIGEFLKELRLAEARSTGVPTVFRKMAENGSPEPVFEFDAERTYFAVTLPAHPEYVALNALREAALATAKGDRQGAIRRLTAARKAVPASGAVAAQLITELCREGDVDTAALVYRDFQGQPGKRLVARVVAALASGYLDAERPEEAAKILGGSAPAKHGQDAVELAVLARRAGSEQRAHQLFVDAGDIVLGDPRAAHEFAQTKFRLAGQLRKSRRGLDHEARRRLLQEAEALLRRVLQMNAPPTRHAWAWFDLGKVLRWLGAPEGEARRAFEEAIRLLPAEQKFQSELSRK